MKLKINKLLTLCTAFCLLLTGAITGLAEEQPTGPTGSIVLNTGSIDVTNKTFNLYRLMDATVSQDNSGAGENNKPLVAYIINDNFTNFFTEEFLKNAGITDDENNKTLHIKAQEYILKNVTDPNFHSELINYIKNPQGNLQSISSANGSTKPIEFNGLPYGYYVIVPSENATTVADSVTEQMQLGLTFVSVHSTETQNVYLKGVQPGVDKTIDSDKKVDSAQIGDTIKFTVKSTVPNMTGFDEYYFKLVDTLSQGLTFNSDNVKVTIGNRNLVKDQEKDGFTVTQSKGQDPNTTQVIIEITNFTQHKELANQEIKFEYSAILNENAVVDTTGNTNSANVKYGNNPGNLGGPQDPSTVRVYTHQLTIKKTDEAGKALSGAKFKIYSSVVESEQSETKKGDVIKFVKEQTDTNTSNTYRVATAEEAAQQGSNVVDEVISGTNGEIILKGMKAATYFIEETEAPAGYNKLKQPTEVKIEVTHPEGTGEIVVSNNTYEIINKAGTLLPETGGMGTVMFTVVGVVGILAVAYSFRPKKNK